MRRFSVIVPAYQVDNYIDGCMQSIIEQDFDDFEIVAIDDASTDATGEILDRYASNDSRLWPIHLDKNEGLGVARNRGIAKATGTYLVFVDGDDWLLPGALSAIDDSLNSYSDPDVLIYSFTAVRPCGIHNTSRPTGQRAPGGVFNLRTRPSAMDLSVAAWDKAYRREFLNAWELRFPPGYYENIPWACYTLFAAEGIATLPMSCIAYRRCRTGSILRTKGRGHFDIFDQYDRMFAFMDANPRLQFPDWRAKFVRRMVPFLQIIGSGDRFPAEMNAEFRAASQAFFQKCVPDNYVGPSPKWQSNYTSAALLV
jgi:CRISPR system Cascade subunit CasB